MNLIDDDELADLGTQKRIRILETPSINRALKVEVQCSRLACTGNLPSEGRLAEDRGEPPQAFAAGALQ